LETFSSILLGIGLSAATGFRIFVPFLVVSIASIAGYLPLSNGFEWIGTYPALITFGAATVIEILAFYIPWFDNALDTIATPASFIAGGVLMVAVLSGVPPLFKWALVIIAGSGAAGIVQTGTAVTRLTSTSTTGGIANPLISTAEAGLSFLMSVLAILAPIVAFAVLLLLLIFFGRKIFRKFRRS
jgi:Domain of unknown function (DUF4126)